MSNRNQKKKRKRSNPTSVVQQANRAHKKPKTQPATKPSLVQPEGGNSAHVKELLNILRGDQTKEEFAQECWHKQPFLSSNRLSRLPNILGGATLDLEYLKGIFATKAMFLQQDMRVIQYYGEEDEVIELQERGQVTWESAAKFLKEGWALTFPSLHFHSPEVVKLYSLFEEGFAGHSKMQMEFTLCPHGVPPCAPLSNGREIFIFQLEGSQDVHIYNTPTSGQRGIINDQDATIYGLPDLMAADNVHDLHVDSICLEKGDCLYIPGTSEFVYFRHPVGDPERKDQDEDTTSPAENKRERKRRDKILPIGSLDLIVTIPCQPQIKDIIDLITKESYVRVLGHGAKPRAGLPAIFGDIQSTTTTTTISNAMPDADPPPAEDLFATACSRTSDILVKSNEIQAEIRDHVFTFCKSIPKNDFVHSLYPDFDLRAALEKNNGLVHIEDFLPLPLAERMEFVLKSILESEWHPTEAEQDYTHNNIAHSFLSSKVFAYDESVFDVFRRLVPQQVMTISAARYTKGHFIEEHDDKANKIVGDRIYERDVAMVYYLARDFGEEDGGSFVDMHGGERKAITPKFNSLVSFVVPRLHAVTPIVSSKIRYSIFGWWMKPVSEQSLADSPEESEDSIPEVEL